MTYTEMFERPGMNYRFRVWSFDQQRVTDPLHWTPSLHWAPSIPEACELVRTTRLEAFLYGGCQLERSDGCVASIGGRYLLEHIRRSDQ